MSAHPVEEALVLHRFEPDPAVGSHLAGCATCRERLEELSDVLDAVSSAGEVPEPPEGYEGYGESVFRRIAPRLRRPSWRSALARAWWSARTARLAPAGALAALLLGAFLLGRVTSPRAPSAPDPDVVRTRVLLLAVSEHLALSQRLLVQLANEEDTSLTPAERLRAEGLVSSSRLFRLAATRQSEEDLASVLEELERLLLLAARSEGDERVELRRRVRGGLLFKVRVLATRLSERQRPGLASPTSI